MSKNLRIIVATESDLDECLLVIHRSFATVAQSLGLTRESCPSHTSFMPMEKLKSSYDSGSVFICKSDDGIAGCCCVSAPKDGSCELSRLAVLPEKRHLGIGRGLVRTAEITAASLGANKLSIAIIEEQSLLKHWYASIGFVHIGIRRFEHLPFTVGFMEKIL